MKNYIKKPYVGQTIYKQGWACNCKGKITKIHKEGIDIELDNGEKYYRSLFTIKDEHGRYISMYNDSHEFQDWMAKYGEMTSDSPGYEEAQKTKPKN